MTTPALPDATRLAVDRTRLAHERTLMAWVRTAVSLISFGFTIYKVFQAVRESNGNTADTHLLQPREFALILIMIALVSLTMATLGHRRDMQALRAEYPTIRLPRSEAAILGTMVAGFGILTLVAVYFRQ